MSNPSIRLGFMTLRTIQTTEVVEAANRGQAWVRSLGYELVEETPSAGGAAVIQAADRIRRAEVDVLLLFVTHGMFGDAILWAAHRCGVPTIIWALPQFYALPTSSSGYAALRDIGWPVRRVTGWPGDASVESTIRNTAAAANAQSCLRRARIGRIGDNSPVQVSSYHHPLTLLHRFGVESLVISPVRLQNARAEVMRELDFEKEVAGLQKRCQIAVGDEILRRALACHVALLRMAREEGLDALTLACFDQLIAQLGVNPCIGFLYEDYEIGCEGDVPLCVGLLMARYLTGQRAHVTDPYELTPNGLLETRHCTAPVALHTGPDLPVLGEQKLPDTIGLSELMAMGRPLLPAGPVTLFRLEGIELDRMHLATGEIVDCDNSVRTILRSRLNGDPQRFLERVSGNHYIFTWGDQSAPLQILGEWLGIGIERTDR